MVPEEPHPPTQGPAVAGEVAAEDDGGPGAQWKQPGEQVQEARLAGAIGTEGGEHRALLDVEVHSGESGEPSEQGHGRTEGDGGSHEAPTAYFGCRSGLGASAASRGALDPASGERCADGGEVRVDHPLHHLFEVDLAAPPEVLLRLGGGPTQITH